MRDEDLPDRGSVREMIQKRRQGLQKIPARSIPKKPGMCRVVVNDVVYFHQFGKQATIPSKARYEMACKTDDLPYVRPSLKVGEDWQPLDLGWISNPSMLHVLNIEGMDQTRIPTSDQVAEIARKVVYLGMAVGDQIVVLSEMLPSPMPRMSGTDTRIRPLPEVKLFVRCLFGEARIQVAAYPS